MKKILSAIAILAMVVGLVSSVFADESIPPKKIDVSAIVKAETKQFSDKIAVLEKKIGNLESTVANLQKKYNEQKAATDTFKADLAEIENKVDFTSSKVTEFIAIGGWIASDGIRNIILFCIFIAVILAWRRKNKSTGC